MLEQKAIIFAPLNDAHPSAVKWALERMGMDVLWSPSIYVSELARFSIHANSEGIDALGPWGSSSAIRSIWARAITSPRIGGVLEADSKFVNKQWDFLQRNVLDLADDFASGLWINSPQAARAAESKLLQLKVAHEVGLLIPETTISNDANSVRELIKKCGKVVFKQFFDYMWRNTVEGKLYSSSPAILEAGTDLPEQSISLCPGIYQRYIDKAFDLRVTVIGDKIFPARLRRTQKEAYVDWRPHVYSEDLVISEFALPGNVEERLRALMKRLGLVFGCVDFVSDHEGHLYFLEVNQQGQFLFIEERAPEIPLLRAMTSMMLEGRTDYSMEACKGLSFSDYLNSEEYSRLLSAPLDKSDIYAVEA